MFSNGFGVFGTFTSNLNDAFVQFTSRTDIVVVVVLRVRKRKILIEKLPVIAIQFTLTRQKEISYVYRCGV